MSIRYFDLERWQRQMSANRMLIEALILACPSGKAASTGWDAAQCLLHLDLTANAFLSQWNRALAQTNRSPGSNYAFWWRWFLHNIENPARLKSKTSEKFDSKASPTLEEAAATYLTTRNKIFPLASAMQAASLGGTPVISPFASWMSYPMDFSFDLVAAHELRHIRQAENI